MEAEPAFNAPTDVIFRLWNRQHATAGVIVRLNNVGDLQIGNFVASRQTRFHAHGKINNDFVLNYTLSHGIQ